MSQTGLAVRLRDATQPMHRLAERSAFMRGLMRGDVAPQVYVRFLRNLHALYDALERELDRHASLPLLAPVRMPELFRTTALVEDLCHLHGHGWATLALADAMKDYVARIRELGSEHPGLLAAHAYIRYMGDLSGGQLVGDVVRRALVLDHGAGTAFYRFAEGSDIPALKQRFRTALDGLPLDETACGAILDEANGAFEMHVRLFEELDAARRPEAQAMPCAR
jgi:heme oxygenase